MGGITGASAFSFGGGGPANSIQGPTEFAHGGSFRVGGSGGTDSQHVSFLASPNEQVTIETPEQMRSSQQESTSGPVSITFQVVANDSTGFKQMLIRDKNMIVNIISEALVRKNKEPI